MRSLLLLACSAGAQQSPNILFIAIDDLNDWVGPLNGHPQSAAVQSLARR